MHYLLLSKHASREWGDVAEGHEEYCNRAPLDVVSLVVRHRSAGCWRSGRPRSHVTTESSFSVGGRDWHTRRLKATHLFIAVWCFRSQTHFQLAPRWFCILLQHVNNVLLLYCYEPIRLFWFLSAAYFHYAILSFHIAHFLPVLTQVFLRELHI